MVPQDPNWFSRVLNGRPRRPHADALHHCASCGRDFVNPVDWEPVTPESWWMRLRCGECHVFREVTVTNAVAERFDIELDRRADMLHRALAKLDRERMVQQAEAMIGALRHGLIDAADFAREPRAA
jgi:hypothetical protein